METIKFFKDFEHSKIKPFLVEFSKSSLGRNPLFA